MGILMLGSRADNYPEKDRTPFGRVDRVVGLFFRCLAIGAEKEAGHRSTVPVPPVHHIPDGLFGPIRASRETRDPEECHQPPRGTSVSSSPFVSQRSTARTISAMAGSRL